MEKQIREVRNQFTEEFISMKGATFIYIIPPPSDQGNGFKTRAVNLASYNGELCGEKHAGVVSTATSLSVHALLHLPQTAAFRGETTATQHRQQ